MCLHPPEPSPSTPTVAISCAHDVLARNVPANLLKLLTKTDLEAFQNRLRQLIYRSDRFTSGGDTLDAEWTKLVEFVDEHCTTQRGTYFSGHEASLV